MTPTALDELSPPPRVLVTKIGLDGHDRGSRIVATTLRNAGMEVIYTPPWQEISSVVSLAMQEDVDVIGISSLATDHLLMPKFMAVLKERGLNNVKVVVGGIIPDNEVDMVLESGVSKIFHPGVKSEEIVREVSKLASQAREG